ncbi:MAG: hypothetical protein ACYDAG_04750 [Chloroflexota bacterium]
MDPLRHVGGYSWLLVFWAVGVAGSIAIALFWVILLVGLLRR